MDRKPSPNVSDELWATFCHCDNRRDGFMANRTSNTWPHVGCGKDRPHRGNLLECDNCEEWYHVVLYPDRMLLCPDCNQ